MFFTRRSLLLVAAGLLFLFMGSRGILWMLIYDLAAILLVVADYLGAVFIFRPLVNREAPGHFSARCQDKVEIKIKNSARLPMRIVIRDDPPESFSWQVHARSLKIKPWSENKLEYSVIPAERGDYEFGYIHWRVEGPLGLAVRQGKTSAREAVIVYPDTRGANRYDLALRKQRWTDMGFRLTRQKGEGIELRELREYQQGDDIRKIDWKATARTGRPVVREYEPERGRTLMIMVDAGRLMENRIGPGSRLDHSLAAALSIAFVGLRQGDRVGVIAFADEVLKYVPPAKGKQHLNEIIHALYGLKAECVEADYAQAFQFLLTRQKKRGIVCLFTDLVDETSSRQLLLRLGALVKYHQPICVTLRDPVFQDTLKTRPHDGMQVYRQALSAQIIQERERAKNILAQKGVAIVDTAPEDLSVALINRYFALKKQASL